MTAPSSNRPLQKAWIVNDIVAAATRWSAVLNIGPFHLAEYRPQTFEGLTYRGKPGRLHMYTAICYAGDEQIELIQPLMDGPSAYSDTVSPGREGFHHLCFWSDDLDLDLAHYAAQGYPIANEGRVAGGGPRFAYVDTSAGLGCMIELLERHEGIERVFASWHAACAAWDGRTPIVRL